MLFFKPNCKGTVNFRSKKDLHIKKIWLMCNNLILGFGGRIPFFAQKLI